jgi:hypothetical protein
MGLDTKTYWLTDRQSQCDFDFDFDFEFRVALYKLRTDRTENPVVLLRQEYRAVDKSRDSQPVLFECDVMRLRGSVFTEL